MPVELVDHSTVTLVKHNASDDDVCHAAWVSNFGGDHDRRPSDFDDDFTIESVEAWEKRTGGLINFLYRERHMSPFEHASFTWFVETPIFVSREWMRHRTASYNEMSSRYTVMPGRFYLPNAERPLVQSGRIGSYSFTPGTQDQYTDMTDIHTDIFERAWEGYNAQLEAGIAREVARNVLPLATMTQFYVTMNPRNVMQFLLLRSDPNALREIRLAAEEIERQFAEAMPKTYAAYKAYDPREERAQLKILLAQLDTLTVANDELKAENAQLKSKLQWVGAEGNYGKL